MLELGADLWWFDRNWHTHLQAPRRGLNKEVWGMRLYHDITRDFRPERRPLIMSNVDGINNGRLDAPSHPAAHRFPVWWTGDTCAEWNYLRLGVRNGVDSGILSLLPYVHEDLGGHHGQPDPELYVRFMQFGAFSPVARIHCTTQVHRYPWEYGAEVEQIVGDYFRLRYRLLPMLYAAAYEASPIGNALDAAMRSGVAGISRSRRLHAISAGRRFARRAHPGAGARGRNRRAEGLDSAGRMAGSLDGTDASRAGDDRRGMRAGRISGLRPARRDWC